MSKPKRRSVNIAMPDDIADWFDAECKARKTSKAATGLALLTERRDNPPGAVVETVEAKPPKQPRKGRKAMRYYKAREGECEDCAGTRRRFDRDMDTWRLCPTCGGTGRAN